MADTPGGESLDGVAGLQERLDELRRSVELLGTQGVWAPQRAASAPPAPEPPPPHPTATGYDPPPVVPRPAPAPAGPEPAAVEPAVPEPASAPLPAFPAASGSTATVAHVDAGPFADLIELRHFEDDLVGLTAVDDVRVRRFGRGRAAIEVGMAGPYDLALELPRLGLPMEIGPGPDGEVVVEFAPPTPDPATPPSEQPPSPVPERAVVR